MKQIMVQSTITDHPSENFNTLIFFPYKTVTDNGFFYVISFYNRIRQPGTPSI